MLEKIFDHIPVMVALLDRSGRIQLVNREWERVHGWSLAELRGRNILREIYPDRAYRREVLSFISAARSYWREFHSRVRDGRILHTCWCSIPVSDGSSIGIGLDLTERATLHAALEQNERRFRLLIEHALDVIAVLDAKGNVLYDSPAVEPILGYKPEERIGRSSFDLVHPEDLGGLKRVFKAGVRRGRSTLRLEFRFRHRDGSWRYLEGLGTNLLDVEGISGVVVNCRDVTDRKRAEEQFRASHDQLRRLSAHLEGVREEERGRIAREIHDELGQILAALKMELSRLAASETAAGLADEIIASVKRIAAELRPGVLDTLGLLGAIEWQCREFSTRSGIRHSIVRGFDELDLDRDQSTGVFRIFQEILTNTGRHARATRIFVALRRVTGPAPRLVLRVRDNGVGIRESQVADPNSLGIHGMRERAALLGGKLEIRGFPGKGTVVTVTIPLQKA